MYINNVYFSPAFFSQNFYTVDVLVSQIQYLDAL